MFKLFLISLFLSFSCLAMANGSQMQQQTLSIIKPDAVAKDKIGSIISYLEKAGLKVVALKMTKLSLERAEEFYGVHKDKPFFADLTAYMSSGPIVAIVLEGKDAVSLNREVMGATNPEKAAKGTIRADFGTNITKNAVHGSDSLENAQKEISFFFSPNEVFAK